MIPVLKFLPFIIMTGACIIEKKVDSAMHYHKSTETDKEDKNEMNIKECLKSNVQ